MNEIIIKVKLESTKIKNYEKVSWKVYYLYKYKKRLILIFILS